MGPRASAEAPRTGHHGDQREPPSGARTEADYARLADPDLFDERRHLREKLAGLPASHPGRAPLTATLDAQPDELDNRARRAPGETT